VSITFDCESGKDSVISILGTLREQEVKATFFVLGKYAYLYPEIVRQIVTDGHEVGNHSFFHPLFTEITPITATQEITYTKAVIDWAVGQHVPMRYFRFPYGGRNKTTRLHAASLGYQSAFWDIDPRGWETEKTPQDVVEHVRHTAHKGGIIIMHCGSWNDATALADVIQLIRDLGMTPSTLTDVLTDQDYNVPNYPLAPPRSKESSE
jgi:peptidoglycan/xylan/chitin deacetylase (PgdA/CDA1 family)